MSHMTKLGPTTYNIYTKSHGTCTKEQNKERTKGAWARGGLMLLLN